MAWSVSIGWGNLKIRISILSKSPPRLRYGPPYLAGTGHILEIALTRDREMPESNVRRRPEFKIEN